LKIRAFLAFDISDGVRANLTEILRECQSQEKGIKWVEPKNMHVTMQFFGPVDEELLLNNISSEIESITKDYGDSSLECSGIGAFPNWRHPRVIWAGFTRETEKVIALQAKIAQGLTKYGIQEDKKSFRPHLTIGRIRKPITNSPIIEKLQKLENIKLGGLVINKLILYKSQLTKAGPVYTRLREYKCSS